MHLKLEITNKERRKDYIYLALVFFALILALGCSTVGLLYKTIIDQESKRLKSVVDNQLTIIRNLNEKSHVQSGGYSAQNVLLQLISLYQTSDKNNRTEELVIANRDGEQLTFAIATRFASSEFVPLPSDAKITAPILLALSGESGTLVLEDSRKNEVLVAFSSIPNFDAGIMVKVNLDEIKAPFTEKAIWLIAIELAILLIAGILLSMIILPIFRSIKESEVSLARAQRVAHLGSWEWNISSGVISWSDEIYRIFGLDPRKTSPNYELFLSCIHPEDRDKVQQAVNKSIEEPSLSYRIEHRIQLSDGSQRVVYEKGKVLTNEYGFPEKMIGTVQNITWRKKAESSLELAYQAIESVSEAILIIDKKGKVVLANPATSIITGFEPNEIVGKRVRVGRFASQDRFTVQKIRKQIIEEGEWSGEIWDKKKTGELYPISISITEVKNSNSSMHSFVIVFQTFRI